MQRICMHHYRLNMPTSILLSFVILTTAAYLIQPYFVYYRVHYQTNNQIRLPKLNAAARRCCFFSQRTLSAAVHGPPSAQLLSLCLLLAPILAASGGGCPCSDLVDATPAMPVPQTDTITM